MPPSTLERTCKGAKKLIVQRVRKLMLRMVLQQDCGTKTIEEQTAVFSSDSMDRVTKPIVHTSHYDLCTAYEDEKNSAVVY